jgi:hypothetical protein
MVDDKIGVQVNGHALINVTDSRLNFGSVGLYVSAHDKYTEARFRNFCLYSIEPEEDSEMLRPMPAPLRPKFESHGCGEKGGGIVCSVVRGTAALATVVVFGDQRSDEVISPLPRYTNPEAGRMKECKRYFI